MAFPISYGMNPDRNVLSIRYVGKYEYEEKLTNAGPVPLEITDGLDCV